jgi:hypothetical protein
MIDSEYRNKTIQALEILSKVSLRTNALLNSISAPNTGYSKLEELLEQIRADMDDAKARVFSETMRLGILGGRGSGKSTLANALMGDNYLPGSAIIFCTSLPTTIKYSKSLTLEIVSELKENTYSKILYRTSEIKGQS